MFVLLRERTLGFWTRAVRRQDKPFPSSRSKVCTPLPPSLPYVERVSVYRSIAVSVLEFVPDRSKFRTQRRLRNKAIYKVYLLRRMRYYIDTNNYLREGGVYRGHFTTTCLCQVRAGHHNSWVVWGLSTRRSNVSYSNVRGSPRLSFQSVNPTFASTHIVSTPCCTEDHYRWRSRRPRETRPPERQERVLSGYNDPDTQEHRLNYCLEKSGL